ncbi:MAG: hypothetical protein H8E44_08485 [Planctomycetes bacterium]|nr:hypothetical protein [Planctomycetota bacterium]MBL7037913.1 hypothetical protein [Pirellulaceae bacterium]
MTADNPNRSQDCPAGSSQPGCHRREFLGAAAAIPAAMATTQMLGADVPTDKAKPPDATPMPQISLGKHSISRLIVGCHNIDGGSHMSRFMDREMRDYYTPEKAIETLCRCEEVGINAWQGQVRGPLREIYDRHRKTGGKMGLFGLTGRDESIQELAKIDGLIALAHHGEVTDRLFKEGKLDVVHDRLKRIRDAGLLVGVSTHMPDVVDAVESKDWDLDYFQTCVYERHRDEEALEKLLGHVPLPIGEVYLKSDPPRMFKAIRQSKRPCLAFKILAAGRRSDVEQAFRETFAGIKPTDAAIVGIYDRYSDQAGQNAAFVRRFGGPVGVSGTGRIRS